MSSELPPLMQYRLVLFCFLCLSKELISSSFAAFFTPFPEQGIFDYIEHSPIIRVSAVTNSEF